MKIIKLIHRCDIITISNIMNYCPKWKDFNSKNKSCFQCPYYMKVSTVIRKRKTPI